MDEGAGEVELLLIDIANSLNGFIPEALYRHTHKYCEELLIRRTRRVISLFTSLNTV